MYEETWVLLEYSHFDSAFYFTVFKKEISFFKTLLHVFVTLQFLILHLKKQKGQLIIHTALLKIKPVVPATSG